ncbi:Uncharacterized protein FWK35_00029368 [Aphis craccivora]|uniref:Double jelly roll-like domain-containing protein n=1 Tax=Aphis craccivora TaxID=307492 RepID=A0A6G0XNT4_APHCR|nr:Uncharacterized protein FWK35_00029368 [Aphis craccivora]
MISNYLAPTVLHQIRFDYRSDFKNLCLIIVVDMSKQNDNVQMSTVDLRIELEADEAFPASTSAYCLILHDQIITYNLFNGEGQCGAVVHKLATTRAVTSSNPAQCKKYSAEFSVVSLPPVVVLVAYSAPHRTHSTGSEVHTCEYSLPKRRGYKCYTQNSTPHKRKDFDKDPDGRFENTN